MRKYRRLIGWVVGVLVVVTGLPLLAYVVFIESMFGVHKSGFKYGLADRNELIHYPHSATLIDVYCEGAGPDGTSYLRFRISASDLKPFMSQKAFAGSWETGKTFDRYLPWLMKWHWRDLWPVRDSDCRRWAGTLLYRRRDGSTEDWPASVVVRPDRPGTYIVYFRNNSI
ncbi:MAG: hypothetical protein WCP21_13135 [Armatimonadota bacterium]